MVQGSVSIYMLRITFSISFHHHIPRWEWREGGYIPPTALAELESGHGGRFLVGRTGSRGSGSFGFLVLVFGQVFGDTATAHFSVLILCVGLVYLIVYYICFVILARGEGHIFSSLDQHDGC